MESPPTYSTRQHLATMEEMMRAVQAECKRRELILVFGFALALIGIQLALDAERHLA